MSVYIECDCCGQIIDIDENYAHVTLYENSDNISYDDSDLFLPQNKEKDLCLECYKKFNIFGSRGRKY